MHTAFKFELFIEQKASWYVCYSSVLVFVGVLFRPQKNKQHSQHA